MQRASKWDLLASSQSIPSSWSSTAGVCLKNESSIFQPRLEEFPKNIKISLVILDRSDRKL
jgi:hypothetical protein